MSLRPTPDSVLKLRNSSSIHVRGCGGTDTSLKLHGTQAWQAENAYANAPASRVNVEAADTRDRKSVGEGKSLSVRGDLGGRRVSKNKRTRNRNASRRRD